MRSRSKNELRCMCSRSPLLAVYGLDERGKVYIHVRIYKQSRIYGEVLVTEGQTKIHCRECLRWHTVNIRQTGSVSLVETTAPVLDVAPEAHPSLQPRTTDI